MIRTWKNGDTMVPKRFTILPQNGNVSDWTNPLIEIVSDVIDSRDGEVYHPESLGFDTVFVSDAVSRGIWSPEEAQMMIGLCLKLYCTVDQPIIEKVAVTE